MKIQFNWNGDFRITTDDGSVVGEWAQYRSLAILQHEGKTYIAGSAYGLLPKVETVYEIGAVATTLDDSQEYIDRQGVEHREEAESVAQIIPAHPVI